MSLYAYFRYKYCCVVFRMYLMEFFSKSKTGSGQHLTFNPRRGLPSKPTLFPTRMIVWYFRDSGGLLLDVGTRPLSCMPGL